MGAKNRVKLIIADCEMSVVSDDSEEYIRETGARVDEYIRNLMNRAPSMSTTLAAIFTALDFCDEATKEKETADNLRSQIKDYFDDAAKAREELERAQKSEQEAQTELKNMKTMIGLKALQQQRELNGE